jgi:phage-related protein
VSAAYAFNQQIRIFKTTFAKEFGATATAKFEELKAAAAAKFEELKASAIAKVQELVDGAKAVFTQLVEGAQQIIADVQATFASIDWGAVGSNIVQGIADGIRNGAGAIADAARNAAKNALDAAKGFLGIQSPSKVMAEEVGLPMAQGLAAGFAGGMDGSALVGIVAGIRSVMEQIAQILKGVGDFVSTSDWEDLAGPVKMLADTLQAIAEIGKTVAAEGMASNWAAAQTQVNGFIASAVALAASRLATMFLSDRPERQDSAARGLAGLPLPP